MKRSEAAKYARWSAAVALALAGVTGVVYLERGWVAHRERKAAPAPAPHDVERQSSGLTFSKVDGNRTIFTVQASKSVDFKGKEASLLEDVRITIFGKTGERHDVLHTQSCQYGKENGSITCSGDVRMELQSAADVERGAAPGMTVETRGVTFERASGLARTEQPVKFVFPNGKGEAVGADYRSEEGTLRLLRDVRLALAQPTGSNGKKKAANAAGEEVRVSGSSLEIGRNTRTMNLQGPAEAETGTQKLTAGEISLVLDAGFHAERLVARAGGSGKRPELASLGGRGTMALSADELRAQFAPEGWVARVEASGAVQGSLQGALEKDEMTADSGGVEMWARVSQPKTLDLNGNVHLQTQNSKTGEGRTLQTSALHVDFSGGKEGEASRPVKAETRGAGSMEWTEAGTQPGGTGAQTRLAADKLAVDFGALGKARQLVATGNVQTERTAAGRAAQTATAQSGVAQLAAGGGWSQMDLQGAVKLREGERSAQAEHAVFLRAAQSAALTGQAVVRDASTETHAARITFLQGTGDIRAEGSVRSTDFAQRGSTVHLAAAPANISSDGMQANSKAGRAVYTGHARLWQGDSVLEAESIELHRDSRVLTASGNVRAVFPQVMVETAAQAPGSQGTRKGPMLWHVSAGTLNYQEVENRAHLERNVVVQSAEQRMRGAALDLYFMRGGVSGQNTGGGAQQISRATGTGGVVVEQGERRGTGERGEYTAADGKFVLSGGNPTLYDASNGTTTGRQLTFFLADDTIIVDSENGSRTLTRHKVEK
jgi:lipopolysaccharide export system protein LptA